MFELTTPGTAGETDRGRGADIALLILLALPLKVGELFASLRWADGDECVVGVMARHILFQRELPIFFWGQPYGGGGAIEAFLAAPVFALFGSGSVVLKMVPLMASLAALPLVYLAVRSFVGRRAALCSALFLIVASAGVEWSLRARGGFAEIPFFIALMLWILSRMEYSSNKALPFVLGLSAGLAHYNLEIVDPFLLSVLGFYLLVFRRDRVDLEQGALLASGLLCGSLPILLFNLTSDWANVRYLFGATSGPSEASLEFIWDGITRRFPLFFQGRNVDAYPARVSVLSVIEMAMYLVIVASAFVTWLRGGKNPRSLECLLLFHVFFNLGILLLIDRSAESPRYFLPLLPSLSILAGCSFARSLGSRCMTRPLFWVALTALVLGLRTHVTYLFPEGGEARVVDGVVHEDGRSANELVPGSSLPKVVAFLDQAGIDSVRTTYFVQWRLLFESQERIVASSVGFNPGMSRYHPFDLKVLNSERVAIVLHKNSFHNKELEKKPGLTMRQVDDYKIYY